MQSTAANRNTYIGMGLAVLATLIWSANFVIARGVSAQIPPVSLAFYRWLLASLIILPFAFKQFKKEWPVVKRSWRYLFFVALTGVTMFNTFVYIGGHYTSAINLTLIGTTTSPVIAVILAKIFLKEQIGWLKLIGMTLCIAGVLFLLLKGDIQNALSLKFTKGDLWVLAAALAFAIYHTLVRKKPTGISPVNFLFTIFSFGTILLFPFWLYEVKGAVPVKWDLNLFLIILYLALGASVICFLIWNIAIHRLGAGRTALFGNLILVFGSIEAVLILHEPFTWIHIVSLVLVFSGIIIANLRLFR
ncbi:MAG: DMT family transporter [Chitinophagaceae bacterium]|nr:DMT family transporter [Chitinophagaceae bacterium]